MIWNNKCRIDFEGTGGSLLCEQQASTLSTNSNSKLQKKRKATSAILASYFIII
jgi:hypothetical protein